MFGVSEGVEGDEAEFVLGWDRGVREEGLYALLFWVLVCVCVCGIERRR